MVDSPSLEPLAQSRIIAITGSRDLSTSDVVVIEMVMAELLSTATARRRAAILFGGARGTDTVALRAACAVKGGAVRPVLRVILPSRLADATAEARGAINDCAEDLVELRRPARVKSSYLKRNDDMLARCDGVLAFWDGRSRGTRYTFEKAQQAGLPVVVVPLAGDENPWEHDLGGYDVSVLAPYVSARYGELDPLSDFIRRQKAGKVTNDETRAWARWIAVELEGGPVDVLVPMPRRSPGAPSDLARLTLLVAREMGARNGTGLLRRAREPQGGVVKAYRPRFTAEEHAASLKVDRRVARAVRPNETVLVLDNVITTSGSMLGALQALERDLEVDVRLRGCAVLGSLSFGPPRKEVAA